MEQIVLEWITRVETPCQAVIYVSRERRQLFLADRRVDAGGAPVAAVDLAQPMSGELPELGDMTQWFMNENVDVGHASFAPVFDFGHEAATAILHERHPMVGVALVGSPEELLTTAEFDAGRAMGIPAGGGVELLPISPDLGALVGDLAHSHVALVLADAEA